MNRLVNINEISEDIRRNRSQLTYLESRIKRLEDRKTYLQNEYTQLSNVKRALSKEQYKELQLRQELISKGKDSKNTKAQWIAIQLETSNYKWDDHVDDAILDSFIDLENLVSSRNNKRAFKIFETIGKWGLQDKGGLNIENDN